MLILCCAHWQHFLLGFSPQVVRYLLNYFLKQPTVDANYAASGENKSSAIRRFLDYQDTDGRTALMLAARVGALDVSFLLSYSPLHTTSTPTHINFSWIPLFRRWFSSAYISAGSTENTQITSLLLRARCDRTLKDKKGMTAKQHAAAHSYVTAMQYVSQTLIR